MPYRLPIKGLAFVQDFDEEEGEDTKIKEKAPIGRQIEIQTKKGDDDRESPNRKSAMPKWLERKLEKKTPTLKAILARAQITTRKEKKPKIRSKVTMDASRS